MWHFAAFCGILGHFRIVDMLYILSIQPLSNINLFYYLSIWCYIRGYYFIIVFVVLESFIFNIFILDLFKTIYSFIISHSPPNTLARDYLANNTSLPIVEYFYFTTRFSFLLPFYMSIYLYYKL